MIDYINSWLINLGVSDGFSLYISNGILLVLVLMITALVSFTTRRIILKSLPLYVKKSRNKWDDLLLEHKVFDRLHHIAPALALYAFASVFTALEIWIKRIAISYMVVIVLLVLSALLDSVEGIYRSHENSSPKPIKGYIQTLKILIFIVGFVVAAGIVIDTSPWILLSGIGAMAAALILIFKDSILGLIASIQITTNDMVCLGDWVEVPRYQANGIVVDITLHIIKIQNWDNTTTTIPTYSVISESFKNWRGMMESGGRLIKRSVYIDITSIKFCSEELLKDIFSNPILYGKLDEGEVLEEEHNVTNLYLYRRYIQTYLRDHNMIQSDNMPLVRNLPPTDKGLPVEIYAFAKYEAWESFEIVQSSIIDHILSVTPLFHLRIFQSPTGYDINKC